MSQTRAPQESGANRQRALLPVCLVSADEGFLELVALEIEPWCRVTRRTEYDGLAQWAQHQETDSAIVLDIDTQGKDPIGGLRCS